MLRNFTVTPQTCLTVHQLIHAYTHLDPKILIVHPCATSFITGLTGGVVRFGTLLCSLSDFNYLLPANGFKNWQTFSSSF